MQPIRFGNVVPFINLTKELARELVMPNNRVVFQPGNNMAYVVSGFEDVEAVDMMSRLHQNNATRNTDAGKTVATEIRRTLAFFLKKNAFKEFGKHKETTPADFEVLTPPGLS